MELIASIARSLISAGHIQINDFLKLDKTCNTFKRATSFANEYVRSVVRKKILTLTPISHGVLIHSAPIGNIKDALDPLFREDNYSDGVLVLERFAEAALLMEILRILTDDADAMATPLGEMAHQVN